MDTFNSLGVHFLRICLFFNLTSLPALEEPFSLRQALILILELRCYSFVLSLGFCTLLLWNQARNGGTEYEHSDKDTDYDTSDTS